MLHLSQVRHTGLLQPSQWRTCTSTAPHPEIPRNARPNPDEPHEERNSLEHWQNAAAMPKLTGHQRSEGIRSSKTLHDVFEPRPDEARGVPRITMPWCAGSPPPLHTVVNSGSRARAALSRISQPTEGLPDRFQANRGVSPQLFLQDGEDN